MKQEEHSNFSAPHEALTQKEKSRRRRKHEKQRNKKKEARRAKESEMHKSKEAEKSKQENQRSGDKKKENKTVIIFYSIIQEFSYKVDPRILGVRHLGLCFYFVIKPLRHTLLGGLCEAKRRTT